MAEQGIQEGVLLLRHHVPSPRHATLVVTTQSWTITSQLAKPLLKRYFNESTVHITLDNKINLRVMNTLTWGLVQSEAEVQG